MGIQMGNTVIPTYLVDCYPLQSMSVVTFYSVFLDLSAFINPVSGKKQWCISYEVNLGADQLPVLHCRLGHNIWLHNNFRCSRADNFLRRHASCHSDSPLRSQDESGIW